MRRRRFVVCGAKLGACSLGIAAVPRVGIADSAMRSQAFAQMKVSWQHTRQGLRVELEAPTNGWIAVGFNQPYGGLSGARLVMVAYRDGEVFVEQHWCAPPRHGPDQSLQSPQLLDHRQQRDLVWADVLIPAGSNDRRHANVPTLQPGAAVHLIAAWSRDNDLQHHSLYRTAAEVTL